MKIAKILLAFALLQSLASGGALHAAEAPEATPYSGDIWTRSTLTGDWGGLRNELAAKGVTLDMNFTQSTQGIVHGGKQTGWQYSGGNGDIILNVDTGKLGLWPGGFLNVQAEGNFIPADNFFKSINGRTGALMPVNSNQLFPQPGDNFNLPALNFTQFLSEYFGLTLGKYATVTSTSGDMNEFAHGLGDTQFMNLALNFNPVIALTVPYSTLGTGVIVLPTKDPKQAIVSLLVLSATGKASTSGFSDLDGNNITVAGEGRVRTDFFGLTGHQLFGATFANKKYTSINQDARIIIENNGTFAAKKGSWNVYYNFDQYFYEPKKGSGEGVGLFGRFGASDGNPNFMQYFYSLGVGGKGVIPNRHNDKYGLGFYYIDINRPEITGLFRSVKLLRDEYGFEAFYNLALTPWLMVTPDIQVVRGAQKNKIAVSPLPAIISKSSIGTSTVLGLRMQVLF